MYVGRLFAIVALENVIRLLILNETKLSLQMKKVQHLQLRPSSHTPRMRKYVDTYHIRADINTIILMKRKVILVL